MNTLLKIVLFLGAGASASIGKPDTKKFNEVLRTKLTTDNYLYYYATFYDYSDVEKLLQRKIPPYSLREVRIKLYVFGTQ